MQDILEIIVGCFTRTELKLLQELDSNDEPWTFRDQVIERFSIKNPSLAPAEEIRNHLKAKIEAYRPLLTEENVTILKDIIFDEIEAEVFVSHETHLGNEEMLRNLKNPTSLPNKKQVQGAIDLILESINPDIQDQLGLEIEGQIYDLRMQLQARGKRSIFATNKKVFKDQLLFASLLDKYSLEYLNNQKHSFRVHFQTLLESLDTFFLYPDKRRNQKKRFHTLNTGRSIGFMNALRIYKAYTRPNIVAVWFFFLFPTIMIVFLFILAHIIHL